MAMITLPLSEIDRLVMSGSDVDPMTLGAIRYRHRGSDPVGRGGFPLGTGREHRR